MARARKGHRIMNPRFQGKEKPKADNITELVQILTFTHLTESFKEGIVRVDEGSAVDVKYLEILEKGFNQRTTLTTRS